MDAQDVIEMVELDDFTITEVKTGWKIMDHKGAYLDFFESLKVAAPLSGPMLKRAHAAWEAFGKLITGLDDVQQLRAGMEFCALRHMGVACSNRMSTVSRPCSLNCVAASSEPSSPQSFSSALRCWWMQWAGLCCAPARNSRHGCASSAQVGQPLSSPGGEAGHRLTSIASDSRWEVEPEITASLRHPVRRALALASTKGGKA